MTEATRVTSIDLEPLWLKRFSPYSGSTTTRLLCFHSAGGSAAMFRHWPPMLPSVEVVGVQLPGRADRFVETPYDRMDPLVDRLVDVITPALDQPFACYGFSMGARVAWALAHALRERSLPCPRALFVAANGGPAKDDGTWPWEDRDDGLEGYVREMGGTPPAVLAEPKLLAALLPVLEADLTVLSTHGFQPAEPLDIPIHAFAGGQDVEATPERMRAWREETTAAFSLDVLPCGHFFDTASESSAIEVIGRILSATSLAGGASVSPLTGSESRSTDEGVAT